MSTFAAEKLHHKRENEQQSSAYRTHLHISCVCFLGADGPSRQGRNDSRHNWSRHGFVSCCRRRPSILDNIIHVNMFLLKTS